MAQVLVISSWVARGHVGLGAAVPFLQGLGHDAVALPTIMLSNHPGHRHVAGTSVPVPQLAAMLDALAANGWLREIAAVLTGYLPSAAHVTFAAAAIARVRAESPGLRVYCDPVLGDDPGGLYVAADVAEAVKTELLPLAEVATPNRFELAWLTGLPVQSASQARAAALALGRPLVLATSVSVTHDALGNLAVIGDKSWLAAAPRRQVVPHGTGDVLAAAFLAARLDGEDVPRALAKSAGRLSALVNASVGHDELQLAASLRSWLHATPAEVTPYC